MEDTPPSLGRDPALIASQVPTLAQWIDTWLALIARRYEPNTVAAYGCAMRKHILPHPIAALPLDVVRRSKFRALARELLESGRATNSIRQTWTALSSCLEAAVLEDVIAANPARGAAHGLGLWGSEAVPSERAMLPDELVAFQAAALLEEPPYRWLFTAMAYVPYRIGEAIAFRRGDLDGDAVWVRRTYHGGGRFGPPKFKRERLMDLGPEAAEALGEAASAAEGVWAFAAKGHRWPLHKMSVGIAFARVLTRAKLPESYTPHALRHTWASVMRAGGVDIDYIGKQLGHASTAITERVYANHFQVRRPELAARFGCMLRARHPALRLERAQATATLSRQRIRTPR